MGVGGRGGLWTSRSNSLLYTSRSPPQGLPTFPDGREKVGECRDMSDNVGKMSGNVGKLKFHPYVIKDHFDSYLAFFHVEVIL